MADVLWSQLFICVIPRPMHQPRRPYMTRRDLSSILYHPLVILTSEDRGS